MKDDINDEPLFTNAPKKNPTTRPKRVLEKTVERDLVETVKTYGGRAYKFKSPAYPSVPDRICILPGGIIFFVEVKAPGKHPTKDQLREIETLQLKGAKVFIVDSTDGAKPATYLSVRDVEKEIDRARGRDPTI